MLYYYISQISPVCKKSPELRLLFFYFRHSASPRGPPGSHRPVQPVLLLGSHMEPNNGNHGGDEESGRKRKYRCALCSYTTLYNNLSKHTKAKHEGVTAQWLIKSHRAGLGQDDFVS